MGDAGCEPWVGDGLGDCVGAVSPPGPAGALVAWVGDGDKVLAAVVSGAAVVGAAVVGAAVVVAAVVGAVVAGAVVSASPSFFVPLVELLSVPSI